MASAATCSRRAAWRVSDRCRTAGTAGAGQAGRYRRQGAGRGLGVGGCHAGHDPCQSASLPACAKGTPQSEQARRAAHREAANQAARTGRGGGCRAGRRGRGKGRCLAGRRRTPGRAVAGAGRWLAGLCGQREGRSRCHCHHRPRRAGRDSSRAAARSGGQGTAHAGAAAAGFRQRRRSRERGRRRGRRAAQDRRHV